MTAPLFLSLASGLPPAVAENLDYFLKEFNTPGWHRFFRLVFGLGLAVALAVHVYYRAREKRDSRAKGRFRSDPAEPPRSGRVRKGTGFSK